MKYDFFPPCKEGYSGHRVCLKAIFDTPMECCCFNGFGCLGACRFALVAHPVYVYLLLLSTADFSS